MTNLFFSISSNEYERAFKEEIWGCFKYIGIPLETVYSMPIHERKYFINRYNMDAQKDNSEHTTSGNNIEHEVSGENLNSYAKLEQKKMR